MDDATPERRLAPIAIRRGGVFTHAEARSCGFSDAMIHRRVASGQWQRLAPGVLCVGGIEPGPQQLAYVGLLASGDRGVLSHGTAAAVHGLARAPWRLPVRIEVPYDLSPDCRHPDISIHRSRSLGPQHVVRVDGFQVADLVRTVVQCARFRRESWLRALVIDALRRGVTHDELLAALKDAGKVTGAVMLRQVIESTDPSVSRTDSGNEVDLLELVLDSDLPRPVPNFEIVDAMGRVRARPDLAWPELLAAAEMDTIAYHGTQDAQTYDLNRQAMLEDTYWRFRRFTPDHVRRTPKLVIKRIATMLDQQRHYLGALGMLPQEA